MILRQFLTILGALLLSPLNSANSLFTRSLVHRGSGGERRVPNIIRLKLQEYFIIYEQPLSHSIPFSLNSVRIISQTFKELNAQFIDSVNFNNVNEENNMIENI